MIDNILADHLLSSDSRLERLLLRYSQNSGDDGTGGGAGGAGGNSFFVYSYSY
jgi:hypothetical protein